MKSYFAMARKASSTLTPVFALVSIKGTPYSYKRSMLEEQMERELSFRITLSRPVVPLPASLPPPSSRPSPQPCQTVTQQRQREAEG